MVAAPAAKHSRHLGHECLLHGRSPRANLSHGTPDRTFVYDFPGMVWVYGGGGSLCDRGLSNLEPCWREGGLAFRGACAGAG